MLSSLDPAIFLHWLIICVDVVGLLVRMHVHVCAGACVCMCTLKHGGQRPASGVIPQELPTFFVVFVFVIDGVSRWG